PRSPARRSCGSLARKARASGISATGMISDAPFANAVSIVVVARRMSNTMHVVCDKSRAGKDAYSPGESRTSIFKSDIGASESGLRAGGDAHVVEEVLLGVAGVEAEVGLDE